MLRIAATIGLKTYYFASEDVDYDNTFWEARISNQFEIERFFDISESTGNRIRSMQITLDNRDNFFKDIEANASLLNSKFVLYFNDGDDKVKTFTGKVNKIDSFGDDVSLTLMERGYEYLKNNFPDAQIAYDYYSESGINDSWNAIPIPFGSVNKIPLAWVNLFRSEFIIGSGPLFNVNKLYFDKVVVYDRIEEKNGYQPTPESQEIKFRIFKGTGSIGSPEVVDGVTSEYPGFAYVQLYKIVDGVEEPADPLTPDGDVSQIYADIEGIVNDTGTAPERNPIKILYMLFTKPYTGYEGYGLEIDTDDLDFDDAILEANIQGFKIDGAIDRIAEFGEWVDELLRCARASLTEEDGKIKVYVDSPKTYSGVHFDASGDNGYECDISPWTEPEVDAQINRLRLSYSWNFERNDFNKKPGVHEESPIRDPYLKDEAHAERIGTLGIPKWNTDTIEFKLIKDDTTAHKLAQYYLKSKVKQLKTTSLVTEVRIPNIDGGDLVKVSYEKFGWVEKEFVVTKIKRNEDSTELDIKEYSIDVYTFVSPGEEPEVPGNPHSPYNIPTKPIMNYLEVVNTILQDGSNQTLIKVEFTHTSENAHMVALYFKEASDPESAFWQLDTTVNKNVITTIWKGRVTGNYNFRIATITSMGIISPITIEDGDRHYYGQPTEEVPVSVHVDDEAPGTPSISIVNPIVGGVSIYITIPDGIPEDFAYFKIFRKLGNLPPDLLATYHSSAVFTDSERETVEHSRVYYAVAVDRNGNESAMSDASAESTPLKLSDADLSADAIKVPLASILSLTAKNCTTESIAEVNGVKDVSGDGNHGQAFGGVEVVDSEMGKSFQFDGVNAYILGSNVGFSGDVTLAAWIRPELVDSNLRGILGNIADVPLRRGISLCHRDGRIHVETGGGVSGSFEITNPDEIIVANEWQHVAVTLNIPTKTFTLYYNGLSIHSETTTSDIDVAPSLQIVIGRWAPAFAGYYFNGQIFAPRIYSRALSPSEIKTLYMFPGDVAFGQITADLVTTGELITKSAQIKEAVITNAHIDDLNAEKIKAGTIAAERIAAGSINTSKLLISRAGAALNDDPNFEDPSAWEETPYQPFNFSHITNMLDGKVGRYGLRSLTGACASVMTPKDIPYDPSKTYRIRAWVRATVETETPSYLGVRWRNATGDNGEISITIPVSPIEWTEYVVFIGDGTENIAPVDTVAVRPYFIANFAHVDGVSFDIQDLRIEECVPSTLIKDGAIHAQHITVDEAVITRSAQVANAIIGNAHIQNLDAAKINSGTIDTQRFSASVASISHLSATGKNLFNDPAFLKVPENVGNFVGDRFVFGAWEIESTIPDHRLFSVTANRTMVSSGNGIRLYHSGDTAAQSYISQKIKVFPLKKYCLSFYVAKIEATTRISVKCRLLIDWYSNTGVYISHSESIIPDTFDFGDSIKLRFYMSSTAPQNASYAICFFIIEPPSIAGDEKSVVVSNSQFEYGEEPTFWANREQGTVLADDIYAGKLESKDYFHSSGDFADRGFHLNLDESTIISKYLNLSEDGLKIKGDITGSSGRFSGELVSNNFAISPLGGYAVIGNTVGSINSPAYIYLGNIYIQLSVHPPFLIYLKIAIKSSVVEFLGTGNYGSPGSISAQVLHRFLISQPIDYHEGLSSSSFSFLLYSDGRLFLKIDSVAWDYLEGIRVIESSFTDLSISTSAPSGVISLTRQTLNADANISRVKTIKHSNTYWSRTYNDGFLEQGGTIHNTTAGSAEVEFPGQNWYLDSGYTLLLSVYSNSTTAYPENSVALITSKTSFGFTILRRWSSPTQHGYSNCSVDWIAKGFK